MGPCGGGFQLGVRGMEAHIGDCVRCQAWVQGVHDGGCMHGGLVALQMCA